MLVSTRFIQQFGVNARDGLLGGCADLLFDDASWHAHFLEVRSGHARRLSRMVDTERCLPLDRKSCKIPLALCKDQFFGKSPTMTNTELMSCKEIYGYTAMVGDAPLGPVEEFLFDDDHWTISNVVIDIGSWLDPDFIAVPVSDVLAIDGKQKTIDLRPQVTDKFITPPAVLN